MLRELRLLLLLLVLLLELLLLELARHHPRQVPEGPAKTMPRSLLLHLLRRGLGQEALPSARRPLESDMVCRGVRVVYRFGLVQ